MKIKVVGRKGAAKKQLRVRQNEDRFVQDRQAKVDSKRDYCGRDNCRNDSVLK